MAKAQTSRRRRPHFAHLTDTGCQTGRETGIHLRAKQLIAERRQLRVPAWDGDWIEMPNPPQASDADGHVHVGRRVDYPARQSALHKVELERWFGTYKPDVYAWDEAGELLVEIRVTHAVDERKAERVQAHGRRMIEIDLSRLDRDTPHDLAAFEQAVLNDPANRVWISCPDAVADWHTSKQELDEQVAACNEEIARWREQQAMAAEKRRRQEDRSAKDKEGRRAYMRRLVRDKHADDLAQLMELTAPTRIERVLQKYQTDAEERVSELLDAVPPIVRSACLRAHEHAWVFGVDPVLWQLLAYQHFVANQPAGSRFNQRDVAAWVRRSFHPEMALYRLFVAQYAARAETRRAGFFKRRMAYWVFTEEENERIPNFYTSVNDFIDRLEAARLIRRLPAPAGEREVLPPPPAPGRDGDGGNPKPAPPPSRPVAAQPLESLPERGRRVPGHSTQVGEPSAD
ncbi:hypothetical protein [Luteimonas lutimaris]|uniref:hypothetical protein n=1 Tax=Luteimonas lutimaris TaxID=698645 RepID=UPI0031DEAC70